MEKTQEAKPGDRLLGELRASTRAHHDRIERLLGLDEPMALGRYGAVIGGFHGFLAAWEPEVRRALPERLHGWLDARGRTAFAAADLAFLGTPLPAPGDVQDCLPDASLAAAFGSLYVIEGSALGGQVITPWLKRDLGLEPGRGASYFHGHGERTGSMWRDFRQRAVAEVGEDDDSRRAACHAAQRTFEALIRHFAPLVS